MSQTTVWHRSTWYSKPTRVLQFCLGRSVQWLKDLYRRMSSAKLVMMSNAPIPEKPFLVTHFVLNRLSTPLDDMMHLSAAMDWLCRAQDICGSKGVSAVYDVGKGWAVAYPETSGYIIGTYLAYAALTQKKEFVERAIELGDWEIEIQAANGGVISSPAKPTTRVFNTGQVLLGWCALYERTKATRYLNAALRAGQFLIDTQENDGAWRQNTYCGARTYHARVDWALLRLSQLSGTDKFGRAAARNLKWVHEQHNGAGWFNNCGFEDYLPITHVIGYTLRGLLESSQFDTDAIRNLQLLSHVQAGADSVCEVATRDGIRGVPGLLPTSFDSQWNSTDRHSCLTGNAQLSCVLFRLAEITGRAQCRDTAQSIVEAVKKTQLLGPSFKPVRGAIPGTFPFSFGYHANSYPNWATKFFADALMMKIRYGDGCYIPA
jgi:hypothetical protein